MRADEFALVEESLIDVLGALRGEYVERVIIAAAETDGAGVAAQAMRIVVLDDVIGTIAARAADTVPQPETESDE